jgi:hypothetical protein
MAFDGRPRTALRVLANSVGGLPHCAAAWLRDLRMDNSPIQDGVAEVRLAHWKEFTQFVEERLLTGPAYVCRGQAHYDWPLVSSLDRLERQYPRRCSPRGDDANSVASVPLTESEHLTAFKRAIAGRRGINPPSLSDDQYWALGQHHGLATPLLDWTRSPFVAKFFSFEEEADPQPTYRGVYALSTSAIDHRAAGPQDAQVISVISDDNGRLVHQGGLFLKMPRHTDLESYIRQRFQGEVERAILIKVRIPNVDRHECLVMLNKMNINRMTLFPDIDGAAQYVNSLWQPGHEDSIAVV